MSGADYTNAPNNGNRAYSPYANYNDFAEFYDRMVNGFRYGDVAEYYDGLIRENGVNGGILLDLACGTGTLSVLLAELGWDVIGVDISSEMLSYAKPHEKVSYICQDMTELDLYGTVDAAVCCFDAVNHLLYETDLLDTFKRVSLFMNTGGVFVFDVNTISCHETIFNDNIFVSETVHAKEDLYCVWHYDRRDDGVISVLITVFERKENGLYERYDHVNTEKAYELDLIENLCRQAGFDVTGRYDFLTKNHGGEDDRRVVFVCKKAV